MQKLLYQWPTAAAAAATTTTTTTVLRPLDLVIGQPVYKI